MPGKEGERWRGKDEVALFKRWGRTASPVESAPAPPTPAPAAQPSELLKFLAIVSIPLPNLQYIYIEVFSINKINLANNKKK